MIHWHQEPEARALLAQLDRSRVDLVKAVSIPADFQHYVGADDGARRIIRQLEDLRTAAIERTLGCSFSDACADRSRHDEIMAVLDAALDVSLAVEEAL
jgi:hypothetical protein